MMSTTFQLSTVFTRLPSFESLKKKFLAKDPLEKWNYVRNINSFLLKVIGCDFLNGNYTYTLNTLLPVFLFVDYFCLMLYTLYYYRNEPLKALESTPMAGIMFPVCIFRTYSSKWCNLFQAWLFAVLDNVHICADEINSRENGSLVQIWRQLYLREQSNYTENPNYLR